MPVNFKSLCTRAALRTVCCTGGSAKRWGRKADVDRQMVRSSNILLIPHKTSFCRSPSTVSSLRRPFPRLQGSAHLPLRCFLPRNPTPLGLNPVPAGHLCNLHVLPPPCLEKPTRPHIYAPGPGAMVMPQIHFAFQPSVSHMTPPPPWTEPFRARASRLSSPDLAFDPVSTSIIPSPRGTQGRDPFPSPALYRP